MPEINFDTDPEKSFEEIKELELKSWRKFVKNDKLWEEGIIKVIFQEGTTLRLLISFFETQKDTPYKKLANNLIEKIKKYYQK